MRIGFHVSIRGGIDQAVDRAVESNYTTFQIFTGNPRQWKPRKLISEEVRAFIRKVKAYDFRPVFAHMPYLPNIASPREAVYRKSCDALKTELTRCTLLEIPYLVTHLGSHLGEGKHIGWERVVNAINKALQAVGSTTMLLLENSAGTTNSLGNSFNDLLNILAGTLYPDRVGICFDTAHAFAAGYDLRTPEKVRDAVQKLDRIVGFEKVKLIHLNDSKGALNSHIDRHEHIGLGRIGDDGFRSILHSSLGRLPLILETPDDSMRSDAQNLAKVRELADERD